MEQTENSSLFGLSIDPNSKLHLAEAARWGKFLAIVGFVMCGFIVLVGVFAGSIFTSLSSGYGTTGYGNGMSTGMAAGVGGAMLVVYLIIALIYFFPCLFLFRFATNAKIALATNDQDKLNASFQNLKAMLRYMGIIMIIMLVIWGLLILTFLASAAAFR